MIISPPFLAEHSGTENDADWVDRMMPVDMQRGYPVNALRAWHGGIHLTHSDSGSKPDPLRAIADGTVASMREASLSKRDAPPFNYSGGTDSGYVLLRHETEIGSGDEGKIVYYSLYMHLKSIDSKIAPGKSVYRKDPLGTVGMVDGKNASHFQIFCDDENIKKIVGRTEPELDLSIDGRTDVVYGDMHFYLPAGTAFYEAAPPMNAVTQRGEAKYTSMEPLFVTMSFDKGNCTMITRQKDVLSGGEYCVVGDILKNVDGDEYEYNLYKYASKLYPDSPSAGYELLRFGRVINTEYETLVPSDAPLWRTVNYPGGKGVVNLALSNIKKFSDGDFPHWIGWHLVDDDTDMNSQCTSPTILCNTAKDLSRMVCHFPLEWDLTTVEKRFEWLKSPNEALNEPMSECDWKLLTDYGKALCLADNPLPAGRVWHFDPRQFIVHFRKCGWLGDEELTSLIPKFYYTGYPNSPVRSRASWENKLNAWKAYYIDFNYCCTKYNILSAERKSAFLGQIYIETNLMSTVNEIGKGKKNKKGKWPQPAMEYYQAFYGRGLMQLTWPSNYESYLKYKTKCSLPDIEGDYSYNDSRISPLTKHYWSDPRSVIKDRSTGAKKTIINEKLNKLWYPRFDPDLIATDSHFAVDSAGFYWVSKHHDGVININRKPDEGLTEETIGRCSVLVNGGGFGYFERQAYSRYIFYYLSDESKVKNLEIIPIDKKGKQINITIDYTRLSEN